MFPKRGRLNAISEAERRNSHQLFERRPNTLRSFPELQQFGHAS